MLTIIGCGNPNRSDDGVGPYVIHRIRRQLADHEPESVQLLDVGTAGMEVMFKARGSTELIIIDASNSGSEPGAVFEVPGDLLQAEPVPSISLHNFRWDHALYAGRRIFGESFPDYVTVHLVEAESLTLGVDLSETVRRSADALAERLNNYIRRHAGEAA